ncbi:hypothetical protein DFP72DRAFT_989215 [Ephemerocybe angulata]|uniref:Uncharacterized protein n=1 Tax=Ephemerocybe angulata TaxID=980116 RepID=A0A8H6I4E1_9AGAR|nr:hypothetical protein DFP72DRAFT_989215 [Tulosesus angulatus]
MVRTSDVLLILVAILFPPAAAAIVTGCSCDLLINILLTITATSMLSGFIYKKIQAEERYGNGGFQYVGSGQYEPLYPGGHPEGHHAQAVPAQQAPYYGATGR